MSDPRTRRTLLQQIGGGAATLALSGRLARAASANDTIGVGVIGCGGRARGRLMTALKKLDRVRIVAVCDVFDDHLEAGRFVAGEEAYATIDYQDLLSRDEVDAVLIATPDHWHADMTVDACAAGKDVYVEKPLIHEPEEGPRIVEAQNRHQRIVQVGTQQRSMPHIIKAAEIVRAARIGPVHKVRMTWNRNFLPFRKGQYNIRPSQVDWKRFLGRAPDQPFDAYKMRNWRWFWDFGAGILTDLMVHWLDSVNLVLDLPNSEQGLPLRAVTIGHHCATEGVWETPDTIQTLLDYADRKLQMQFDGTFVSARHRAMTELMGEDATLYFDRGRYELHPERFREIEPEQWVLGAGPPAQDFYDNPDGEALHLTNWLECIRTRQRPNAPAEAGVLAASAAILANQAYREKRLVERA